MALTKKKKDFADAMLRGANKTQAAMEAGCTAKSASTMGSRYAQDSDVILYMKKRGKTKPKVESKVEVKTTKKSDDLPTEKLTKADVERVIEKYDDPLEYLMSLVNSPEADIDEKLRVDCAKAALPYYHGKIASQGKKEAVKQTAQEIASGGFFTPMAPPGKRQVQ